MSSIIFALLLVSGAWCNSPPINAHPQPPHDDGSQEVAPVMMSLHPAAAQPDGPPGKDGAGNAKPQQSQDVGGEAAAAAAGGQPADQVGRPQGPNAGDSVAAKPANGGDTNVETGHVDTKVEQGSADKKDEKGAVDKKGEAGPATKNGKDAPKDTATKDLKSHKKFNRPNATDMDSSTLKRLVLVLVAFSVMFIMYLAFRTYRRGRRRGPIIVSKYGVRTRRSDLEMRPLPLDDDDEDETVFDLGNVTTR